MHVWLYIRLVNDIKYLSQRPELIFGFWLQVDFIDPTNIQFTILNNLLDRNVLSLCNMNLVAASINCFSSLEFFHDRT